MSSHLPSRWLFAAALLAAGVPTSAAVAQSPEPLNDPPARLAPQTAPVPLPIQIVPTRLYVEPLLLEEEQVSEHGDRPHAAPLIMPAPRVLRACGLPECDQDEDRMAPGEVAFRCLLFSINPLAAFLPMRIEAHTETLPSPTYMQNTGPVLGALGTAGKNTMAPPQYIPPTSNFPLMREESVANQEPELVVKPQEVERLEVMPIEVEQLDVMPVEEESEPEYQLLAPWTDYTRWFKIPTWPLAELKVSVKEPETGSVLFGVGAEVSLSGTIAVTTEPPVGPQSAPAPDAPGEGGVLPKPRQITEIGQSPVPTRFDLNKYKRFAIVEDEPTFTFEVIVGHTRLLHLKEAPASIKTGDTPVFDYTALEPKELLLKGESVGSTSMFLWFGDRKEPEKQTMISLQINVLPEPPVKGCPREDVHKALQDEINRAFPDSYVHLALVGDKLLVSGEVKDAIEADRIIKMITQCGNEEVNKNIINRLEAPKEKQVNLKVTLAAVNRTAARNIGLGLSFDKNADRQPIVIDKGRCALLLEALRADNLAKCLAEPNLVAVNGHPATIFSGGEIAMPVLTGNTCVGLKGASDIPFGITLTFTPIITDQDRIRLTLDASLAALGSNAGIEAKTINPEVEMRQGQTVAVGGLMPADFKGAPRVSGFLGLPLIGELMCKETPDTELILLVTPEIVQPQKAVPAACPASSTMPAACQDNVCRAEVPKVQLNMLVAEVKGKAARKLNLDHPADGTAPRWMIEVADEARQKTLDASLTGLREKGHATVIAEPRMITCSGQQGTYFSGSELAVPVVTEGGQASVRFEQFGTSVMCLPLVMADGTIRLEVEPEISERCEGTSATTQGVILPGRSSQRVHTTANIPPGHTLVISGPKASGDTRLVIFVTPTVIETHAAAAPTEIPNPVFDFGSTAPQRRIMVQMNQSENLRKIEEELAQAWMVDQPTPLTSDYIQHVMTEGDMTVHDLLVKCQRELSRSHYASAEDLAQKAIERDRKQVAADPLVLESDLLQRVKAIASLPLGTVDPCAAKGGGGGIVSAGAAKAIGSDERIVEVLLQEFNTALNEARYHDANALAERACDLDPENAMAAAALQMARSQGPRMVFRTSSTTPALPVVCLAPGGDNTGAVVGTAGALARFQGNFKEGRYEEAKADALRALAVAPGNPVAVAALQQACEALARQPRPEPVPQCTYVGTKVRPILPSVDPAVVGALRKILIEGDKGGSFGGVEEAEPKDNNSKLMPRR